MSAQVQVGARVASVAEARVRDAKIAALLAAGSVIAVALIFPYLLVVLPKLGALKIPLPVAILASCLQAAVVIFALGWVGLRMGESIALSAPVLRSLVSREPFPKTHLLRAAAIGLVAAAACGAVDRWLLFPTQPEALRALSVQVAPWKGFLASFYGGLVEEVEVRLFVMTVVAFLLIKRLRVPRMAGIVLAIVVSSLLFAAGHLPAAARIVPLTSVVVGRILVLNSAMGVVFGWCFWRWGLEHAIVAHFVADLVLHVLFGG